MVTIISQPKTTKQIECRSCGAVIGYNNTDVKSGIDTDYTGGRDRYKFISCPCCSSEIRLPGYVFGQLMC